jgi:hypothetical protein
VDVDCDVDVLETFPPLPDALSVSTVPDEGAAAFKDATGAVVFVDVAAGSIVRVVP